MKTRVEIEALKQNWLADPCWDIEETEGFEDHREELEEYRIQKVEEWKDKQFERLFAKAEELGIPGNVRLAQYVMRLEEKIVQLSEKLPQ